MLSLIQQNPDTTIPSLTYGSNINNSYIQIAQMLKLVTTPPPDIPSNVPDPTKVHTPSPTQAPRVPQYQPTPKLRVSTPPPILPVIPEDSQPDTPPRVPIPEKSLPTPLQKIAEKLHKAIRSVSDINKKQFLPRRIGILKHDFPLDNQPKAIRNIVRFPNQQSFRTSIVITFPLMQRSHLHCLQSSLHWRFRKKGQDQKTPPRPRERHLEKIIIKRIRSPTLPGRRKEKTRFWTSNWHRHYVFCQTLTSPTRSKSYLGKFRLHNPTKQEINSPSPPHLRRRQIRLPWQPKLTWSINAQCKNTHQQ